MSMREHVLTENEDPRNSPWLATSRTTRDAVGSVGLSKSANDEDTQPVGYSITRSLKVAVTPPRRRKPSSRGRCPCWGRVSFKPPYCHGTHPHCEWLRNWACARSEPDTMMRFEKFSYSSCDRGVHDIDSEWMNRACRGAGVRRSRRSRPHCPSADRRPGTGSSTGG